MISCQYYVKYVGVGTHSPVPLIQNTEWGTVVIGLYPLKTSGLTRGMHVAGPHGDWFESPWGDWLQLDRNWRH